MLRVGEATKKTVNYSDVLTIKLPSKIAWSGDAKNVNLLLKKTSGVDPNMKGPPEGINAITFLF